MDSNKIIKHIRDVDEDFKLSDYTVEELESIFDIKKNNKKTFKDKYFEYYDDIKSSSLKKQDW